MEKTTLLSSNIIDQIEHLGFSSLTEIQQTVIPMVWKGENILFIAPTGSGKTLAYALPIFERIDTTKSTVQALIIVPTRELALQVRDQFRSLKDKTNKKCSVLFGGTNQKSQTEILKKHVPILVVTPGKCSELIQKKKLKVTDLACLVLDEADMLIQKDSKREIETILKYIPKHTQKIFCSATNTNELTSFAKPYITSSTVMKQSEKLPKIEQIYYRVHKENKFEKLKTIIQKEKIEDTMIFVATKEHGYQLSAQLKSEHIPHFFFHHDLPKEKRKMMMQQIKKERTILITTDLAARGIDISNLSCVIQYDVPEKIEAYIHRIGRTGRSKNGRSILLIEDENLSFLRKIESTFPNTIKNKTKKEKVEPNKKIKKKQKHTKNIGKRRKKK